MDSQPAIRVQVPAAALRWPPCCACCCGPADAQLPGGAVPGAQRAAGWAVPYCSECLGHAARFVKADQIRRQGYFQCTVSLAIGFAVLLLLWALAIRTLESLVGPSLAKALTLLAGAAVVVIVYFVAQEALMRARTDADRIQVRARELVRGTCGNRSFAVTYAGGDGATHTFEISNQRFAADFRRLNGGQRLG